MSENTGRSFTRGLVGSFAGNIVAQSLGLASGVLAARFLGPLGRGELATIRFYPMLLALLGSMGIQQAVAFEISRRPHAYARILRAGFWLSLAIGIPEALLAAWLIPLLLAPDKRYLAWDTQWFFVYIIVDFLRMTLLSADQGAFRFSRYNVFKVLPLAGYVGGMSLMTWLGQANSHFFSLCYQVGPFIAFLVQLVFSWRELGAEWPCAAELRTLLKGGIAFQLPQFLGHLQEHGSLFVVVTVLPADDVGVFMVALAIAMAQFATAIAFMQVGFVKIAGESTREAALVAFLRQFRAAQITMLALSCAVLATAPFLIQIGFGKAFLSATGATYWMVAAIGIMGLVKIIDGGLRALDHSFAPAVAYAFGLIVLAGGGFWLVPAGGIVRMGQVALASSILTLVVDCVFLMRLERVSVSRLWGLNFETLRFLVSRAIQMRKRKAVPAAAPGPAMVAQTLVCEDSQTKVCVTTHR
jgi:O-antigen/teichoic acid export membrane protein